MPDGRIEPRQVERLKEMGAWVSENSEAVYGTRGGPYLPTANMVSTHKDSKIYLHLLEHPGKKLKLPGEDGFEIQKVYFLGDGSSIPMEKKNGSVVLGLPTQLPDAYANVVVLELDRPASDLPNLSLKP
jgi:alpha-L-fucosidase